MKQFLRRTVLALFALFLLAQLVPYGHGQDDPPTTSEPPWDSPRTRELARRACFDCHSREPDRPWYAHVAPVSWLIQRDIEEGRAQLDFSAWDRPQREAHEASEVVAEGEMPPAFYTPLHPHARLSTAERFELQRGLERTLGLEPERGAAGEGEDD